MTIVDTARTVNRDRLQQMLDALVAAGSPWALAQFRDSNGTWSGASGVAELGGRRPVAADSCFRIGSVTKTFTATVILQLVGENRLGLDDTVERWLPALVPGGDKITLRQLLDHTSGLYNYTDDLDTAGILRERFKHWRPQEVVALATRQQPRFEPGTARAYCNTSFILLGMVIEKVTGRRYDTELTRRILRPLDLRQTLAPGTEFLPEPHAHGYLPVDGQPVDITTYNDSKAWAAGGMVSTADDINRFYAALLTGGLLRPAELRAMQTTMPTAYSEVDGGLGVTRVRLSGGVAVWGKDGGFFGYHVVSFHTADASRQLTMSMTTALNSRPVTHEFLASIASVFGPEEAAGNLAPKQP